MQTITLKVKNDNDISLLILLAERLGISIVSKPKSLKKNLDNSELFFQLDNLRKKNDLFTEINNPISWQKEIRNDRNLLNRD